MKMCNSEAMKVVKELENKKRQLIYNENYHSTIQYKEGEEKVLTSYDYAQTRKAISEIDEKVRKIKHALALCNSTVIIDDFGITLGEALVYVAQLNAEYNQLSEMSRNVKLTRRITQNGIIEYTECLYEPENVTADREKIQAKISKLQIAIDRANLTNYIDV